MEKKKANKILKSVAGVGVALGGASVFSEGDVVFAEELEQDQYDQFGIETLGLINEEDASEANTVQLSETGNGKSEAQTLSESTEEVVKTSESNSTNASESTKTVNDESNSNSQSFAESQSVVESQSTANSTADSRSDTSAKEDLSSASVSAAKSMSEEKILSESISTSAHDSLEEAQSQSKIASVSA